MAVVRTRASFLADVRVRVAWLTRHRDVSHVTQLRTGLQEVRSLLARFPTAGPSLERRERLVLRSVLLRRLPFVVFYVVEGKDVWLLRLFHHRQDRLR